MELSQRGDDTLTMTWLQNQIRLRRRRFAYGTGNSISSVFVSTPNDVTNLVGQAGGADTIDLSWDYGPGDPLYDFQIQYDNEASFEQNPQMVTRSADGRTKALGPGLSPDIFYIRVRARNSISVAGNWSDVVGVDLGG